MKQTTTNKLLALWAGKQDEWLKYKEIVNALKDQGIGERTANRYLATLVHDGKLDKEERGYKRTFYRPNEDFLHKLSQLPDWLRIHEESLNRIGSYVMSTVEEAVIGAEETTEKIRKEIDSLPEHEKDSDERIVEAVFGVLSKRALTEKEGRELTLLFNSLLGKIYNCLSNPYVHGRIADPDQVAPIMDEDIWSVVCGYMDVWRFIYEHPGALLQFKREYESTVSSRRS